jgi:hypothetical protein
MNWILKLIVEKVLEYLGGLFKKEVESKTKEAESKAKNEENAKDLADAIAKNASKEEIARRAEDLINGN